jgi:hypothetical protein
VLCREAHKEQQEQVDRLRGVMERSLVRYHEGCLALDGGKDFLAAQKEHDLLQVKVQQVESARCKSLTQILDLYDVNLSGTLYCRHFIIARRLNVRDFAFHTQAELEHQEAEQCVQEVARQIKALQARRAGDTSEDPKGVLLSLSQVTF